MLTLHIITTLTSMFLGYSIFLFRRRETIEKRVDRYLLTLCILLLIAAVTGILLNLHTFSPFHILSIVTITTIPISLVFIYQKRNYFQAFRGVFYNFLGLNLALIGALLPMRTLGYRLWIEGFWLSVESATLIVQVLFVIGIISAIYLVYRTIRDKTFFQ